MAKKEETTSATSETKRTSKYDWVDTASTTHQLFTDPFSPQHIRKTWMILAAVTVVAVLFGWYFIATSPKPAPRRIPPVLDSGITSKLFSESGTLSLPFEDALARTTDHYGHFYIADQTGLTCFDISGSVVKKWSYDELILPAGDSQESASFAGPMTAICFVPKSEGPASLADRLLVAQGAKVYVLKVNEEDNNLYPLPVDLPDDAVVSSLCVNSKYVFLADWKNANIKRFNPDEPSEAFTLGLPDEGTGFPGFRLSATPHFDIGISESDHLLYALNPGLFQIAVFSPETGQWMKERSWDRRPWATGGFSGLCNPLGLALLSDGYLIASEESKTPTVRLFTLSGQESQKLLTPPSDMAPYESAVLWQPLSVNENTFLLIGPEGKVSVYVRRANPVEPADSEVRP
ncbi:MAG: hypothetical protein Q4G68_06350 [Planctomycetia bacterium]|nr:hypothetical protein [Planctomycetia bacterium]